MKRREYNLNKLLCNQLVDARSTFAYELESHAIPALNMLLSCMITCLWAIVF